MPLLAGMRGRVVQIIPDRGAVIEGQATVVSGLWGMGREVAGPVVLYPLGSAHAPTVVIPGCILIVPGAVDEAVVRDASAGRAGAIFAASAAPQIVEELAGMPCAALLDGTQPPPHEPPCALALAHGFGNQPLGNDIIQAIAAQAGTGEWGLIAPATNLFRNQRPELLLSLRATMPVTQRVDAALEPGAQVWVIGGVHAGASGKLVRLLGSPFVFPSGIHAHAARVQLEDGTDATIALANLQRVG
jgi:hypothetical protein